MIMIIIIIIMIDNMFRIEDNIIDTVNSHIGLQKNALLLIFHLIFCLIHHQTSKQILFHSERLKYWMCSWKRHRIYCFFLLLNKCLIKICCRKRDRRVEPDYSHSKDWGKSAVWWGEPGIDLLALFTFFLLFTFF